MGDPKGFLRIERVGFEKRDPSERVHDYRQYFALPDDATLREQGGRCMDCGVPFCHEGCPLGNRIPDWNDLVYRDRWRDALTQLHATNNFPEFTGLICPAPCESACVLDINDDPVTIEQIELAIATRGFEEGWIDAEPPDGAHRQDGRGGGLGPGRAGGGRRAEQARPPGDGLRARRGARRAAALRRSRREAREVDHRPPRGPARGGGHRVRLRRGRGRRRDRRGAAPPARRGGGGDRLAGAPRPRGARPRAEPACTSRWTTSTSATAGWPQSRAGRARATPPEATHHAPRAGAWWSWAAATPGWTACRTPCARARRACCMLDVYPPLPGGGPPAEHAVAAAAQAHAHHLRARRGRRARVRHRGDRAAGRGRAVSAVSRPAGGGHLLARPASRCRAATSRSPPSWC